MRRMIGFLLILCLTLPMLAGCAKNEEKNGISVVAAIFPEYDWARQLIGPDSNVTLHLLVDDGVDPHSFQPSVADMVKVSQCDLLIYGGGESDRWLEDVLAKPENKNIRSVTLLPLLGQQAHEEEIVEGMQAIAEEGEADEHVWLSLRNAQFFCTAIARELCQLDPDHAKTYESNLDGYLEKLQAMDEAYQETLRKGSKDTIVVCDRFPYRYLTEDYGINYYAAFPGCSAETGASFETVVFLANRVKELGLNTLIVTETSDTKLARTVAENAGRGDMEVLVLNAMQSISGEQAQKFDYLSIMEDNRRVLEKALG